MENISAKRSWEVHGTEYRDAAEAMAAEGKNHPTAFEMETALAFLWFGKRNVISLSWKPGWGSAGCHGM